MTSRSAWVVSGGGRFGDPWHPFAETSEALASALRDRGDRVVVSEDADVSLAALSEAPRPDLLVLNIGWYGPERFTEPATRGLVDALESGVPTLLVHSTLTAFPDWPLWREIAGGGWTYGTTYHPDYAGAVALADPEHAITAGLDRVAISDERYTRMWVDDPEAVFLEHEEDGERHPLAWTRVWGASPIVADALGHDAASYRDGDRSALLKRELDWLADPSVRARSPRS
jgi:type 1 glutamine amidotransferase